MAVWLEGGQLQGQIFTSLAEVFAAFDTVKRVLIDMPIGLLESQERLLESEVRRRLGPRRSSVFPVPCYAAAYATDYPQANSLNRQHIGKGLSKQAWYLAPKIREVNELLTHNPAFKTVLGESHPELAFSCLSGAPMRFSKKQPEGFAERLEVLDQYLPRPDTFIEYLLKQHKRRDLAPDDCVDALVLLAAAPISGVLSVDEPQVGRGDVPIQMWVPQL